ncbi:uncharacterized protein LOC111598421 isoform X2 [Drosophila hydei]|uniref:Uncharacterized protein LOC111598421 isoform X2 n=1 Tax=Drosophila hydei TaxID=7224 RepID=A0A6J1LP98_DROHY|nr:uncharacterized protein LOC111598421 isoform X2 [Drosophila hydei]
MPHSERPSSPEDHISDQYFIYRLEHDLYELFEEQQLLLDIVAQQQERLERQLEMQRVLVADPPARQATPVPELLQIDEIGIEAEAEPAPFVEPELLVIRELNEPPDTLLKCSELVPPLPPPRCICSQMQRQTRRSCRPFLEDSKAAKCTPPKRGGLGYDAPFPYPKRMAKNRERRALFIFALVDNLVLQLQRCMSLAETGALPLSLCSAEANHLVIVELEIPKEEPVPAANLSTGALPKTKFNHIDKPVKRSHRTKAAKHLHKQPKSEADQLDTEIDLDCEFGMDHIEKFRANRVRDDERSSYNATPSRKHKTQKSAEGLMNSAASDDIDGEVLAAALASLAINEDTNTQQGNPSLPGWYENGMAASDTQLDTRPCSPEVPPFSLLPGGLHGNSFINLMPSTSAQARALSMAMSMSAHLAESVQSSSSPSPLDMRSQMSTFMQQQHNSNDQMQTMPDRLSGLSKNPLAFTHALDGNENKIFVPRHPVNGSELNAATCGIRRLNCGPEMCSADPLSSSTKYNHFNYNNVNNLANQSNSKDNGNIIQSSRMDICGQEYAASSPGNR